MEVEVDGTGRERVAEDSRARVTQRVNGRLKVDSRGSVVEGNRRSGDRKADRDCTYRGLFPRLSCRTVGYLCWQRGLVIVRLLCC